jgi:phospholipase/carboxylesterase
VLTLAADTMRLRVWAIAAVIAIACGGSPEPRSAPPALVHTTYTLGADAPAGLLVALHYSSSTPAFWDDLVRDLGTPVRVLAPQGPRPHRGGFTWFAADHEAKDAAGKTADVEAMAVRIAALIRETRAAHPEIRRVAVTGFSYGGDLAWMLAIRYPELVDVAVPMGTRLLGEPAAARPARVVVLQGEVDAIIDARATAARVDHLKTAGVPIELTVYPGLGHDMSPALLLDWRAALRHALGAAP